MDEEYFMDATLYKAYQTTTNIQVIDRTINTGKTPNVIKLNKLQQIYKSQRKQ